MAHGPYKKRLDFGGSPDHATLGLELGLYTVTVEDPCHACQDCVTVRWAQSFPAMFYPAFDSN